MARTKKRLVDPRWSVAVGMGVSWSFSERPGRSVDLIFLVVWELDELDI